MSPSRAVVAFTRARSLELAVMSSLLASMVASVIIARAVGPAGRGEIVVLTTWAPVLGAASGLSIDKALMAHCGRDGRHQGLPLGAGLSALLSAGSFTAMASVMLSGLLVDDPVLRAAMPVAVLGTVAFDARAAALLVHGRWQAYAALRLAQPVLYLLGCAAATGVALIHPALGVGAFGVALCLSLWLPALLIGGLPRLRFERLSTAQLRTMFAFAGAYHVGSVLSFISSRADLMTMPLRFSDADVGVYAIAVTAGQLVALLGSASLLRGLTGRLTATKHFDRAGLCIALILAGSVAAVVGWVAPMIYGPGFAGVAAPARLLCIGGLLSYVTQGLNGRLAGIGRPWATALVNGASVVTFLALIPMANTLVGVAAVNVASTAFSLVVAWWLSRHSRTLTREVPECASDSIAPPSGRASQPALRPSPTASSADLRAQGPTNSR